MRLNLFFAFIVSTFLCSKISDVISFFIPKKAYWIYIIPAVFLLVTIIYKKVAFLKKTATRVFLILSTLIPYFVLVFYVSLCIINYPAEIPVEAKLKAEYLTEQEIDAGNRLAKMIEEFDEKIAVSDQDLIRNSDIIDSNKSTIVELIKRTSDDRKKVLEFINRNSIAIPNTFDKSRKLNFLSKSSDNSIVHIRTLIIIYKLELFEVERFKTEKKYDQAVNKYISTWNNLANAYKIKNTDIIGALCLGTISQDLGEYFYNNQNIFLSYDFTDVTRLKEDIINNLDRTYKVGFSNEYISYMTMLGNSKNIWPLMDKNKFLRRLDDYYYSSAESIKNPLDIVPYEESVDFGAMEDPIFLKDYIGEFLYTINEGVYSGISQNAIKQKNEISVYFYAMDKNNYQNVPRDYFTGEKIKINEFSDRIEIDVYTTFRLDKTQRFVIIK